MVQLLAMATPVQALSQDLTALPRIDPTPVLKQRAFNKLKTALTTAPALALPNSTKPFQLFVHKTQEVAKGVLTQTVASLPKVSSSYSPVSQKGELTNLKAKVKLHNTPCGKVTTL
ncbi:Gag-Pol polyprotein [Plecturocebus cupreus]